jgi:hypothetical protein
VSNHAARLLGPDIEDNHAALVVGRGDQLFSEWGPLDFEKWRAGARDEEAGGTSTRTEMLASSQAIAMTFGGMLSSRGTFLRIVIHEHPKEASDVSVQVNTPTM